MTGGGIVQGGHPIDRLEFVLRDPNPSAAERFTAFLGTMRQRSWTIGPPELVDEHKPEDACRNLGCVLELYCAHPPWLDELPCDIDAAQFRETVWLVGELCVLSRDMGPFIVWFDGEEIGEIANGKMDESLEQGLLTEWETGLRTRAERGGRTRG